MSDDGTRTGYGWKGDKTQTMATRKLQVRMASGKIYGPYTRTEVLSFIKAKKIKGEEQILIEGETAWRAITSDTDFFDALQAQLFKKSEGAPATGDTKVSQSANGPFAGAAATKSQGGDKAARSSSSRKASTPVVPSVPIKRSSLAREAQDYVRPEIPKQESSASEKPSGLIPPSIAPAAQKAVKALQQKKSLLPILAVLGIGVAFFVMGDFGKGVNRKPNNQARDFDNFAGSLWYTKPLTISMQGVALKSPPVPVKLEPSGEIVLPEGFGAPVWIEELKTLSKEEDPKVKVRTDFWARRAWSEHWLGSVLQAFNKELGNDLVSDAAGIVAEMEKQKALSPSYLALFKGAEEMRQGDWQKAYNTLVSVKDLELAQWLGEEAQWQLFWSQGGKGAPFHVLRDEYTSTSLEIPAKIRAAFSLRDRRVIDWLDQQAKEDPTSSHLWFTSAEMAWRFTNQVQAANRLFITGLATLSLLPASFQAVYWSQFSEFLTAFGRQSTAQRAAENKNALESGNVESKYAKSWWDLNQEGLDITNQANDIVARSSTGLLNSRDLASLYVLGFVMPNGSKYLTMAGEHWAFERNWRRASKLFEQATVVDKMYGPALGGLVWSYASQYKFDKAFQANDRFASIPSPHPEAVKYLGVIQYYGREYENAVTQFTQYLKKNPIDGWSHYFLARTYEAMEKNLDCVKSANLARVHGKGELGLRAKLLYYECRIKARAGVKEALAELKRMAQGDRSNVPILVTYLDALAQTDLLNEAIQAARDGVASYPRSYELRVKLGELYEKKHDYDRAVAFYLRARKDRPDSAEPLVKVGRIFELQRNYVKAAENYTTASRIEPEFPEVWLYAARAYSSAGMIKEAAAMYMRELDERPSVLGTFIEASEFLLKNNAPQEVPALFQKFTSDFQDDPRVLTRLAQAYLAMGEIDKAQTAASTALARNPKLPEPNRVLGYVFEKQNYYEEAAKYFQRYLELLPQAADSDEIRQKLENPPYK